jgi:hypothetical protein
MDIEIEDDSTSETDTNDEYIVVMSFLLMMKLYPDMTGTGYGQPSNTMLYL